MNHDSSRVANYFLDRSRQEKKKISFLKLLGISYIAHGWCLAALDRDILGGEEVQAWPHGPVIPSIYYAFNRFGKTPITSFATDMQFCVFDDDLDNFSYDLIIHRIEESDVKLNFVLGYVWTVYKQYSASDLVNMTHESNTPWKNNYKVGKRSSTIPNEDIKSFYEEYVTNLLEQATVNARAG